MLTRSPSPVRPSYKSGFARRAESAYPELWDGLIGAWVPGLGVTGATVFDLSGYGHHGSVSDTTRLNDDWKINEYGGAFEANSGASQRINITHNWSTESAFGTANQNATFVTLHYTIGTNGGSWAINENGSYNHYLFSNLWYDGTFRTARETVGSHYVSPLNRWTVAAIRRTPSEWSAWQQGRKLYSTTAGTFDIEDTSSLVSSKLGTGYIVAKARFSVALVYNRALSDKEIQLLSWDTFAPFRKRRKLIFSTQAAGGGGTSYYNNFLHSIIGAS